MMDDKNKTSQKGSTTSTNDKSERKSDSVLSTESNKDKKNTSKNEKSHGLEEFFLNALYDIYYAEQEIKEALEKVKVQATTEMLQDAIEDHELVTKKHILRLEKVFRLLGEEPKKKKCEAIVGILKEVNEMVKQTDEETMTRDVAIILGAQKVEHYEIATYGGLVQLALTLGYDRIADLLETTLEEEEQTDAHLTDIAEQHVNFEAAVE